MHDISVLKREGQADSLPGVGLFPESRVFSESNQGRWELSQS